MTHDYRSELFDAYAERTTQLELDPATKIAWFDAYVRANYLPYLGKRRATNPEVLEIGCGRGYLLIALRKAGFRNLSGIDLSPDDVAIANGLLLDADIQCADAFDYLRSRQTSFDVIVMKAVLEHVSKPNILPLLRLIAASLKPDGVLIVDVPNMDWLFASHERYMDLTHEVGLTRESLQQVVGSVFSAVEVVPAYSIFPSGAGRVRRLISRRLLGTLLGWADPEGGQNPIWARSLIAVAGNPRVYSTPR
jgi:2-polyprenyl-3-methyl-5-hydroxy-6-metoxy-1,4-benzoquinol methylase